MNKPTIYYDSENLDSILADADMPMVSFQPWQNIVLVGLPGCGKSTLGMSLAFELGMGFLDLDSFLEDSHKNTTAAQLYSREGEAGFRSLEGKVLDSICNLQNHVIATGGGVLEESNNKEKCKKLGVLVWVQTSPSMIAKRFLSKNEEIKKRGYFAEAFLENNMALTSDTLLQKIQQLYNKRKKNYQEANCIFSMQIAPIQEEAKRLHLILKRYLNTNNSNPRPKYNKVKNEEGVLINPFDNQGESIATLEA